MVSGWKGFFHFIFLQYLRTLLVSMAVKTGDCNKILWKLIRRTSRISQASSINLLFYATIPPPHTHTQTNSHPVMIYSRGKSLMLVLKLLPWKKRKKQFLNIIIAIIDKHCQRHNGPEGWVHLAKVTSWGHIRNSNISLDHISSSESRLSIN